MPLLSPNVASRFVIVPQVRARRVTLYGIRTHYMEAGDRKAPPVVLVHGGVPFSSGEFTWPDQLSALGKDFHVVAPDLVSFGQSDTPAIDYSFQTLVEHLAGIIDTLDLGRVHLVGQSMGAYVAAKYACDNPDRVRSLTMINTSTVAQAMGLSQTVDSEGIRARKAFDGTEAAERRLLEALFHRRELITDQMVAYCLARSRTPETMAARQSLDAYRAALRDDPDQEQVFSLRHRLPRLRVPTMLIWGDSDRFANREELEGLLGLLPGVKYVPVAEAGHFCFRDQPEIVNAVLASFFAEVG